LKNLKTNKPKYKRLQEELKLTKATDQKENPTFEKGGWNTTTNIENRISFKSDSLNRLNQELQTENIQIKQQ